MSGLDLMDCDEWCKATSVTSKSAVKTFGFEVENFENVIKSGSIVNSSSFKIEDTNWSIRIYGDEHIGEDGDAIRDFVYARKGFVGMYLWNENDESYRVEGRMAICGYFVQIRSSSNANTGLGLSAMISHDDCIKNLVDGKLYVKAEVAVVKRDEIKLLNGRGGGGVSRKESDLSELVDAILTSRVYSDFKLVSNGVEFDVHKSFIAAQSETLHGAVERWSPDGKMLLDEYKPEVVRNLINYFYRKQLEEDVFEDNVAEFLNIGEKYDLPQLKTKAELSMITNLGKETFIEYLIAGDLFKAAKLKEAALKFIAQNKNLWNGNSAEMREQFKGKQDLLMEIIAAFTIV